MKFDNNLAHVIDDEAATTMEQEGYDIKFVGPLEPAYRDRKTETWSHIVGLNGPIGGTILAEDYQTLLERIKTYKKYEKDGKLKEWHEKIYLPERAEIVFKHNMQTNDRKKLSKYFKRD